MSESKIAGVRRPWGLVSGVLLIASLLSMVMSLILEAIPLPLFAFVAGAVNVIGAIALYLSIGCFAYWLLDKFAINRGKPAAMYPTLKVLVPTGLVTLCVLYIVYGLVAVFLPALIAAQKASQG